MRSSLWSLTSFPVPSAQATFPRDVHRGFTWFGSDQALADLHLAVHQLAALHAIRPWSLLAAPSGPRYQTVAEARVAEGQPVYGWEREWAGPGGEPGAAFTP